MKSILMKHTGMPIPDLGVRYEIDVPAQVARLYLERHLDSELLIDFAQRILEGREGITVIDRLSKDTFGRARIPEKYGIVLRFAGLVFDVEIVQLGDWLQGPDAPPIFTISMLQRNK
jgi:hypothetical protein